MTQTFKTQFVLKCINTDFADDKKLDAKLICY